MTSRRLLHLLEHQAQKREQIDIVGFGEARAHDRFDLRANGLEHGARVLITRLPMAAPPITMNSEGRFSTSRLPPGIKVAADNRTQNDDKADDYERSSLSDARSQARTISGSK